MWHECDMNFFFLSLNSTVPWGNSLAPSKHLHTLQSGIYLPAASTPSKCHHFVWAKPSVLLTKAQCSKWWKINRGRFVWFPQDYADDKRQRLGREKANGVCSSNCSGGVCGVAAVWGEGQLRRLFVWVLWRRGVVERVQAGSIQQQRFPMWQHNTLTLQNKGIIRIPPSTSVATYTSAFYFSSLCHFSPKENEHVGLKWLFPRTTKSSVVPCCRKVMFFVFHCKGGQWRQPRKCFR